MASIKGRVVTAKGGVGIPGLLVSAQATLPAAGRAAPRVTLVPLGSTFTGDRGTFALEYEPPAAASSATRVGYDISVTVAAADGGGGARRAPLASQSRDKAGPRETFVFRVPEGRLRPVDTAPPSERQDAAKTIARDRAARAYQEAMRRESRRVAADTMRQERAQRKAAEAHFARFLRSLSRADARPGGRYVPPGGDVGEAALAAIEEGVKGHIGGLTMDARAVLTADQLARLREEHGSQLSRVPAAAVEALIWKKRPSRASILKRWDPAQMCRRLVPINDCVAMLDPAGAAAEADTAEGDTDAAPAGPDGAVPATALTVPDLITRLTAPITAPEEGVRFGIRPGLGDVQGTVDGFALHSGPADVPATYDFHRLEIAFEPVWQELFDQGVIDTGLDLYKKYVELGLDPNEYLIGPGETIQATFSSLSQQKSFDEPPAKVAAAFEITQREWAALNSQHREELEDLADEIEDADVKKLIDLYDKVLAAAPTLGPLIQPLKQVLVENRMMEVHEIRAKAERIIRYAREKLQAPKDFDQFHDLLKALNGAMKEPYRFNVYAAGRTGRSINFGVIVTYRQKWTPVSYQVGELLRTVPLAPKEARRYSRRLTRKLSRSEQEVRNSLQSMRTESSVTTRVETEIIKKAMSKTNFELSAQGGFNVGVANASGATRLGQDSELQSHETKREFREAVFKATAEYKAEHKVEVNLSNVTEFTDEESGELINPNDELAVTYLFYELQRRYRVEEQLAKVSPVVLVAQEFPKPNQIDEDWIVAHDWILRRVILDDSFIPAMNYLASKVVGDEHALSELYLNLQQQRRMLEELTTQLVTLRSQVNRRYEALQRSIARRADAIQADEGEGFLEEIGEAFLGSGDLSPEAMRIREDAAKDAYERLAKEEKDMSARLERETTAIAELTQQYTTQLSDHLNRRAQISRLRVHIKANIFYYMQAIWSHEPPDQRYFRLRDVRVPRLQGQKTYDIVVDEDAMPLPPTWTRPHKLEAHVDIDMRNLQFDALGDIADLDSLLGFKGNYMIFPLKQENALTDFMMTPYYDPFTGLRDPDTLANWTLHEFAEYVCCLREHSTKDRFDSYLPGLIETYRRLRERAADDGELVVPTGSLFIEALPGAHPILEDFKLAHRGVDVKRAQAEVRGVEMENLRMAARLLADEREDPRIDKKIVIEGPAQIAVDPDDA